MGSPPALRGLLSTGRVWLGRETAARSAPRWCLAEVAGRYTELCGGGLGGAAVSTAAAILVRDAQRQREPVAWVADPAITVFPPDLAGLGVDLGALVVVRADTLRAMLRAADQLLRSGAFGLVVVDLRVCEVCGEAAVPMAAQVRLAGLAKQHESGLVLLSAAAPRDAAGGSRDSGSLASLRLTPRRVRLQPGRFRCSWRAVKDKRRGHVWECEQVLRGPMGLR